MKIGVLNLQVTKYIVPSIHNILSARRLVSLLLCRVLLTICSDCFDTHIEHEGALFHLHLKHKTTRNGWLCFGGDGGIEGSSF